jgi:outer membrane protein
MKSGIFIFSFWLLLCPILSNAQMQNSDAPKSGEPWTLEECIAYSWKHNLQVKQSEVNRNIASNNLLGSKANLLPNVSGFASNAFDYGKIINPFTNTFDNSEVTTDNFYLSGSWTLFGWFQNYNALRKNQSDYKASGYDVDASKNNIALNIASGYLQVLLDRELLKEAQNQTSISKQQVDKTKMQVDAGTLAKSNLFDIQAQEANDEVNEINAKNQLDIATLTLAQLLDVDSVSTFSIAEPEIEITGNFTADKPEDIYTKAVQIQPDVLSSELKWESSTKAAAIAKGALLPKLSLVYNMGTGFSTANQEISNTTIIGYEEVGAGTSPTTIEPVLFPQYNYQFATVPFGSQLSQNFNKAFGFQLVIPIFNGLQSNVAYRNARLNEQYANYTYQTTELNLRKNTEQAYTDALGTLNKYYAMQKSVESFKEAFNYTKVKFDVGMATALDFNTAKNNLAKAESDLLQAKYNYVFKLKVIDFYEGKPLKL